MGRYEKTGLMHGTKGSADFSFENLEHDTKVIELEKLTELEQGVKLLEKAGVKFKKEDVLFVVQEKSGQLIWLEKGNSRAGLEHILNGDGKENEGHAKDFKNKFGVSKEGIPNLIKEIITNGKLESSKITNKNGQYRCNRIYSYLDEHYMFTSIGSNGFLVTAYPLSSNRANNMIKRNKK